MEALSMSKADCLKFHLQKNGQQHDHLVIGAIILKPGGPGTVHKPSILLLKRAAHEPAYPHTWEIPGGKVEDSDPTILDAVKREVFEETGLKVERVIGAVKSFEYAMEKKDVVAGNGKDGGEVLSVLSSSLQLNYVCVCEVGGYDWVVVVDPEEHSEGRFVDREALREMEMTEQMRAVVEEAFEWAAEDLGG